MQAFDWLATWCSVRRSETNSHHFKCAQGTLLVAAGRAGTNHGDRCGSRSATAGGCSFCGIFLVGAVCRQIGVQQLLWRDGNDGAVGMISVHVRLGRYSFAVLAVLWTEYCSSNCRPRSQLPQNAKHHDVSSSRSTAQGGRRATWPHTYDTCTHTYTCTVLCCSAPCQPSNRSPTPMAPRSRKQKKKKRKKERLSVHIQSVVAMQIERPCASTSSS